MIILFLQSPKLGQGDSGGPLQVKYYLIEANV